MRIGIDARPLISKKPSGIGQYVIHILEYMAKYDKTNEYYLYSNVELEYPLELGDNFYIRIIPGRIGTLWLHYKLSKYLQMDAIEVFWGTQHILPNKKVGKYVLTVHDVALLVNPRWGSTFNAIVQNIYLRKSVKRADKIIAISEATKTDLIQICGVQKENIVCIYNGGYLDVSCDVAGSSERIYVSGKSYFLYIGTIEPRKNIETLVSAFERLCTDTDNIDLVIAGGKGWKCDNVIEHIEKSPYQKRIHLTGYISEREKYELLTGAEALVFPTHYEGFGLPVIEALSLNCIVITSSNSSLTEVGGDAAFYLSNENDVTELVALMKNVLTLSCEERKKIKIKGQDHARKFLWEKCAKNTVEVFFEEKADER